MTDLGLNMLRYDIYLFLSFDTLVARMWGKKRFGGYAVVKRYVVRV